MSKKSYDVCKHVQDPIRGKKSLIIKLHGNGNDNENNKR